ncbi:hypothetical protein [Paramicrobacterium agarici]|uniref:Uncharacterized protein n=1 Tax=Paramicrobacterium agarici TaxID=630514 RepID=A0A2A9DXS1_9MICO|nr:hypothetical protein [Microbacterium agarici]PFG30792.1 hypothetical protein ATJ78_1732 [Microbacterium agarici]
MTDRSAWVEHRRPDGERVGWMLPDGDGFIAIDLLGRHVTEPVDWLTAEETLDERGIGYLAEPYRLTLDSGHSIRVRLAEVSPTGIRAKLDDFGDVSAPQLYYDLGFPAPESLAEWGAEPVTWPAPPGS